MTIMFENRAVAPPWLRPAGTVPPLVNETTPTTGHAPTPGPTPVRAMPERNGLEGRSRTLQGPSAKEWGKHRGTIIALYRQYPLKRVSEIMKSQYGFSASKRMYDKRFREWNVFKNSSGEERARAVRRARSSASMSPKSPGGSEGNFSQEDLRRTVQCARTIQQHVQQTIPPTGHEPSPLGTPVVASSPPSQPCRQPRRSISISDLIKQEDEWRGVGASGTPHQATPPPTLFSPLKSPCITPDSSPVPSDGDPRQENSHTALVFPGSRDPDMDAYRSQLQDLFRIPHRPMCPDQQTRTMSFIGLKLREYFDWQLRNIPEGVLPDEYLGHRSPDESTQYWNTIKNAIYLVKVSIGSKEDLDLRPDRRAWSAFAEAGSLAAGAMTSQPFDFLRNLFATLSPANTSARPELRNILLRFLTSEAQRSLSSHHPITHICKELQNDGACQEISQRSLQCMLDIFNQQLERSRAITFKLLDSLATLLRRSGEYHAGLEIVTELLSAARPVFGPDSDQVRSVENELAHFYMLAGDSDMALGHCMSVVTRPPPSDSGSGQPSASKGQPTFYQDGIAAHTMEDIAEIHQRRGDLEQCIAWLERAASIALIVWGPKSIATGHLIDKMTSLQRQLGKDLLESATNWEAVIV